MTSVFANVFRLTSGESVWANVFVLDEASVAIETTRHTLYGTAITRHVLAATSATRHTLNSTAETRNTLTGATR